MKFCIIFCLFFVSAFCYEDVYDMGDGNAIMTMNYLLTGIVVPWVIAFILCCISCICCCIPKKHQATTFVAVPQATIIQQQPVMMVPDPYGQTQMVSPGAYGGQVMSPMTNMGQPIQPGIQEIEIPSYTRDSGSSGAVYYDVMVSYQEKKWKLVKRYSEFEDLHNRLNKIVLNMPYLPAKSLFKLSGAEIDKRRLDLEKYSRALSLRKDIVQLPDFLSFVEFESYTMGEIFAPIEIGALLNLPMNVTDFVFVQEAGVLFVALSDTSILSKMDDIFASFTNKSGNDIRGCVMAYKLLGNPLKFQVLWRKDFKSGTTCIYWDDALTFLAVGFDDGSCECIRVSTEHYYKEFDEFCIVKRHTAKITGCGFYSLLATLYTISKDKTLVVTDITKTTNFALEEKTFLNELTFLLIDNSNKRMFIADSVGTILIYGLDIPLQLLHRIQPEYPQVLTTLSMDIKKRFLLAGSSQGMIYIYELGKPGKEKLISLTSKIEASKNVN